MEGYVKFTVEIHDDEFPEGDRRLVWEKPSSEVTSEDMAECIRTLMYGLTFTDKTINDMFVNYVLDNKLLDKVHLDERDISKMYFDKSPEDDYRRNRIWDEICKGIKDTDYVSDVAQ